MKKTKFLALLMSATIALNIAPVYAVESAERMTIEQEITIEKTASNYNYSVDGGYIYFDESTGTITGAGMSVTSANIPSTINGVSVTSIGKSAFFRCESLTSITIPNSVTSIEGSAFRDCSSLTSITIPNSVTSIGDYTFQGCESLTSITIPNSVTWIGQYAFRWCESLTSITIPNSVTSIGDRAFWGCESLTSITIPNSVTSIGESAFASCSSLTSITVDSNNPSYLSQDGILFNKNKTEIHSYPAGKTDNSYTIPNSVTSIGGGAFWGCKSLTSITIPNSVTSIGDNVFSGCENLTSITIPNSVTSIETGALSYCTSLTSITIPNSVTSIGDYAFYYCTSLTDVYYTGSQSQWNSISIHSDLTDTDATIHYDYIIEPDPNETVDTESSSSDTNNETVDTESSSSDVGNAIIYGIAGILALSLAGAGIFVAKRKKNTPVLTRIVPQETFTQTTQNIQPQASQNDICFCVKCGNSMPITSTFCGKCGSKKG